MDSFLNSPFNLGALRLENRLIQGPLAGFTKAPFRRLFYQFQAPAFCVSEMLSAIDVLTKHEKNSSFLYRAAEEKTLAYQLAGTEPCHMAEAAKKLVDLGANLIDLNCGCPKTKIRKKGAGSALLARPQQLLAIVKAVRQSIPVPLTVKIRLQAEVDLDLRLAKALAEEGIDGLIVHGRQWQEDYDIKADWLRIAAIKRELSIPVIANGDISDQQSLAEALATTACDAFMIARAGTGKPWVYQNLLRNKTNQPALTLRQELFMTHLQGLASLDNEQQALLKSRSLLAYYFPREYNLFDLNHFYQLETLAALEKSLYCCLDKVAEESS